MIISKGDIMTNKDNPKKVINVKIDADTKSKLDTLAYLQDVKLQDLCIGLINDALSNNADAIAEVEKARAKFKK